MRRVDSLEKTLMLEGIGGRRRRGWQRMRWLDGMTNSMDMSLSELGELVNSGSWWWTGRPGMLRFMGSQKVGQDWTTELNWDCIFKVAISILRIPKYSLIMLIPSLHAWTYLRQLFYSPCLLTQSSVILGSISINQFSCLFVCLIIVYQMLDTVNALLKNVWIL